MANFYLRVPHYVASYFRNKDKYHPVNVGGVVHIESDDPLWYVIHDSLCCNVNSSIHANYCFTAKQWQRMMSGYSLSEKGGIILKDRFDELTISDKEITLLTGLKVPRNDDSGEYLCIAMPKEVWHKGRIMATNTQWYLTPRGAGIVRKKMVDEFWRALFTYMDTRHDVCANKRQKFVVIECLESFMERYDITNSMSNAERDTLKRNMNRKRKSFKFSGDDYVEHG